MNRPNDQRGPFRGGYPPRFRGGGDASRNGGRFGGPPPPPPPQFGPFRGRGGGGVIPHHPPIQQQHPLQGRGSPRGPHGRGGPGRMNGGPLPPMLRPPVQPPPRGGSPHGAGRPTRGGGVGPMMTMGPHNSLHYGRGPPGDNFRGVGRPMMNNHLHGGQPMMGVPPPPPPPPPAGRFGGRGIGPPDSNSPFYGTNNMQPAGPPFRGGFGGGHHVVRGGMVPPPSLHIPPPPGGNVHHHPPSNNRLMPGNGELSRMSSTPLPSSPESFTGHSAAPVSHSYTKQQLDAAWTEHVAPDGVTKYFYNSLSQESTFYRPESFGAGHSGNLGRATASQWKEYSDPTTGKVYYSNGVSTQWTKPEELVDTTQSAKPEEQGPQENNGDKSAKKRRRPIVKYESKDEAIAGFKELLLSKDVAPSQKWSEVAKMLSSDDTWIAAEAVLSTGERKQALAEYQTKRSKELRTIERQQRQQAKEEFQNMLTELLPSVAEFSAWSSSWTGLRSFLVKDERFHSIEDEGLKETLFVDFCEEYRKRDDRRRRAMKREAEESFLSFLRDFRQAGRISATTTWNAFYSCLNESERADTRFSTSEYMSEAEQQHAFTLFVDEIQAAQEDEKRRSYEERRQAQKARKDSFRESLMRFSEEKKLLPSSLWRDSQPLLIHEPSYRSLSEQEPQAPREIFERFVEDWNNTYLSDRATLSRLVGFLRTKADFVTDETSYEEFVDALMEVSSSYDGANSDVKQIINDNSPVSSTKLYFDELKNRAKLAVQARRGSMRRRDEESSEDEGEIVEEDQ